MKKINLNKKFVILNLLLILSADVASRSELEKVRGRR